jgi:hypothetical protein
MRTTRDLLRRRMYLMRKRAELLTHIQNTNSQYRLTEIGKKIAYKDNRDGVAERFPDPAGQKSLEVDLALIGHYDQLLRNMELSILNTTKQHHKWAFSEAAVLFLRDNPAGQKYLTRLEKTHGKGKALTVLAHKLARAVYCMLKRHTAFEMDKFLNGSGSRAGEPDASLDRDGMSLHGVLCKDLLTASLNAKECIGLMP